MNFTSIDNFYTVYWLFGSMKDNVRIRKQKQEILRTFRIVVAAVIVKEGSVLLLQRKDDEEVYPGLWELTGEKCEFNETSIKALVREVKEETGLSIVVERPISVFEYVVETLNEIRDTTQINFLTRPTDLQETIQVNNKEHQAVHWFTKKELFSL